MAVGSNPFPAMPPLDGVRLGAVMAGIKKPDRRDVVVIELPDTATVSGVFTRNAFCAAPVVVAKQHLEQCRADNRSPRFWLINTGNANAGTGEAGLRDARASCAELAKQAGLLLKMCCHSPRGSLVNRCRWSDCWRDWRRR